MFKKLKMKLATKRMQREKDYAAANKQIRKNETESERAVLFPFRMIARALRWIFDTVCAICSWIWDGIIEIIRKIWKWLCGINLVGLINLALLVAIIVLFSMLIINVTNYRRSPIVITTNEKEVTVETKTGQKKVIQPMPIKNNETTTNVTQTLDSYNNVATARATSDKKIYGDIIIESREDAIILKNGAHVRGNVYLQHMYKYVLPCDIKIEGNLFLRDLNMLHFCGRFDITGNIYVTPNSSFGPIPRDAYLGGQIIL
ncbi:MAG: hypothetical protein J6Y07_03420 [Alphaproteobacteria bacterium]|nr:hypothetical protein [Alphaproteobacteria bacterium]